VLPDFAFLDGTFVPQAASPLYDLPYAHWAWEAGERMQQGDLGCVSVEPYCAYDRWARCSSSGATPLAALRAALRLPLPSTAQPLRYAHASSCRYLGGPGAADQRNRSLYEASGSLYADRKYGWLPELCDLSLAAVCEAPLLDMPCMPPPAESPPPPSPPPPPVPPGGPTCEPMCRMLLALA
jgi:hypothetical protein